MCVCAAGVQHCDAVCLVERLKVNGCFDCASGRRQRRPDAPDEPIISYDEWLALQWHGKGTPPEPLPIVREVTKDEYLAVFIQCMEDAGFPNSSDDPERFEVSVPKEQVEILDVAEFQCAAQYPWEPKYYQRYNSQQLQALYAHQTGPLVECLTELGYAPDAPPTLEKFATDYRGQVMGRWFPLSNVPEQEFKRVEAQCPLEPEGFFDLATVQ